MKSRKLLRVVSAGMALCMSITLFGCNNNETSDNTSGNVSADNTGSNSGTEEKPNVIDSSAEYQWTNVQIAGGGYTPEIIYNPTEEGLVYSREDIGGAYRMNKETGEWIPITDQFGNDMYGLHGIDGLATDPVEPNRVYLLAGMYSNGWVTPDKAYLLCSEDYGNTWSTMTPLTFASGGNEPNRGCDRLVIDPNDNKTIYIGSRKEGLWVSHDYGKTVEKVSSFPTDGTEYVESSYTFGITSIAFDKNSGKSGEGSKTIYVATGDKTVYQSTDAGKTWSVIEELPQGYLPHHVITSGDYLYIVYNMSAGPYQVSKGSIRKFNTKTKEIQTISPSEAAHGWGDLAIDPKNPDILTVSTMGKWGANENDNIYRSTDGGKTWKSFFTGDGEDRQFTIDYSQAKWLDWGTDHAKLGWMMNNISINPFNGDELMYGTGATVFKVTNLSALDKGEQVKIVVQAKGIEETAVKSLVATISGDVKLYSGMGDIDGFSHTDVNTVPEKLNGDGYMTTTSSISCAFNKPEVVARCGDGENPIGISSDSGKTWENSTPKGSKGKGGRLVVSCDGSSIYWTNNDSAGVFRTDDLGKTWTKLEKSMINAELATDNFNADVLYAFTGGFLFVSKDKGKTFTSCKAVMPEGCSLTPSPDTEGELWIASSYAGVYKVTNFGEKEEKMGMMSAKKLAFGAKKEGSDNYTIYTIGEVDKVYGIYRSLDMGKTWERINDDMHQFGATGSSLAADYHVYGQVYFGSEGRGILMGKLK